MINFLTISICQEEAIYKKESFIHFQKQKMLLVSGGGDVERRFFPWLPPRA